MSEREIAALFRSAKPGARHWVFSHDEGMEEAYRCVDGGWQPDSHVEANGWARPLTPAGMARRGFTYIGEIAEPDQIDPRRGAVEALRCLREQMLLAGREDIAQIVRDAAASIAAL